MGLKAPHIMMELAIGIDDTDSPGGMCTTYLGFRLVGLLRKKVRFVEYPRLVRLNPNIPWKTRGNGAIGLRVYTDDPGMVRDTVCCELEKNSKVDEGANPAAVFLEGKIPEAVRKLSRAALWRLISRGEARRFVRQNDIESFHIGNGQGLIGALGAIGYEFGDATLELLCYRKNSRLGMPRHISEDSVRQMQLKCAGTFNSYDEQKHRVMIAPRGPDPVLYGIRGEDAKTLLRASSMVRAERPAGYMMFKSNQGTADHLAHKLEAITLEPYASGTVSGTVSAKPEEARGGHLFFTVQTGSGPVRCAVYRESGMAHNLAGLEAGDEISVGGGVRPGAGSRGRILNAELVEVLYTVPVYRTANPQCPGCSKNMKSAGRAQGFECRRCGTRHHSKIRKSIPRTIHPGLYVPVLSAQRHLARPLSRLGKTNTPEFGSAPWFGF